MRIDSTYHTDFYKWAVHQSALLRSGRLEDADIDHIAEEIESMGKSEKRELINRLKVLLAHILKWEYQPFRRSRSWQLTVKEQRLMIQDLLEDNPSLKAIQDQVVIKAYRLARTQAARETGLEESVFPEQCPYDFDEALEVNLNLVD